MLRAALAHAGGVRIDHVLGLKRLWMVPRGAGATEGAYVRYPLGDMLRLIALESHLHRAIVIGEDLGTVPTDFRQTIADQGVLGIRVLWFERAADGGFIAPTEWSGKAMATTSTHDVPTVAGWWSGRDVEWRKRTGLDNPDVDEAAQREVERVMLWRALFASGSAWNEDPRPRRTISRPWSSRRPGTYRWHPRPGDLPRGRRPGPARTAEPSRSHRRDPSQLAQANARFVVTPVRWPDRPCRMRRDRPDPASGVSAPRALARLQFHAGFTLDHAIDVVGYYARLGVSHLYASPILRARAGSTHGYDVVDCHQVNPEIGGEDALRRLVASLRTHGMGLILDIVPNHMGVGVENAWWMDVLRHGRESRYAGYFDIEWQAPDPLLKGRLLLPILGAGYEQTLREGHVRLVRRCDEWMLRVYDDRLPLSPATSADVGRGSAGRA